MTEINKEIQNSQVSKENKLVTWPIEKLQTLNEYLLKKPKLAIAGSMAGVIILGASFGIFHYQINQVTLYHVYVDGKEIGTVDNKSVIEIWESQQLRKALSHYDQLTLDIKNDITYVEEKKYKGEYDNLAAIDALNSVLEFHAVGVEVVVNGEVVGIVKDQATADRILDQIKQSYMPKTDKDKVVAASVSSSTPKKVELDSIEIKEDVNTEKVEVSPDDVISEEDMLQLLQKGTLEEKIYTVKEGDTISEIAVRHGLTSKQVYQMNPQLDGELIHIGDELVVTAMTPKITVESKETVTQIERIPFKVVYQRDDSMYVNETKTIQAGIEGQKEVQFSLLKENGQVVEKTILNETILREPVDKIVKKGTKIAPERGSGQFVWPTVGGRITSYFGPRWGRHHDGIDISGVRDYTIKAADNGKVIFAGWKSGYGYTVKIDHGNGYVTLYGHLSKITVSVGDTVAKGQKIGVMGSTGRSTGTHLHFEVQVNGVPRNPINYVGK